MNLDSKRRRFTHGLTGAILLALALIAARQTVQHTEALEPILPAGSRELPYEDPMANLQIVGPSHSGTTAIAPGLSTSLYLGGVIAAEDPRHGLALIGASPAEMKVYRVGADLPGGGRLHQVFPTNVLIDLGGEFAVLTVSSSSFALPDKLEGSTSDIDAQRTPVVQPAGLQAPGELSNVIRYGEVRTENHVRAIVLTAASDARALTALGLRPGDLLIAINGKSVETFEGSRDVFHALELSNDKKVTIVRNGEKREIELSRL